MTEILVPCVNSLVILDSDGARVIAKYYDGKKQTDQEKFEKDLHKKSKAAAIQGARDSEVLIVDHELIAFRVGIDCRIFISGSVDENDLILVGVLDCLFDSIQALVKNMDAGTLLDCMELVLLAIDEIVSLMLYYHQNFFTFPFLPFSSLFFPFLPFSSLFFPFSYLF